jgi:membrane protease YdiL (CAAX protease family)
MSGGDRHAWQRHPLTQLAAVVVGVLPIYVLVLLGDLQAARQGGFQFPRLQDTFINLLILVLGFGGLLLVLLRFVCGERLADLQRKSGSTLTDVAGGVLLALALIGTQVLFNLLLAASVQTSIPEANLAIAYELADDPLLLAFWLGPLVWLQAGFFEEFTRVFMLSRLWQVWPGRGERWAVLLGSALLFGLGHAYQGALGIAGTALIGFILGWHYLIYGRVLPLIIGHALYDTVVLLTMVAAVRYGAL